MLSHRSVDTIIRLFGRAVIITCSQISIKAAFSCLLVNSEHAQLIILAFLYWTLNMHFSIWQVCAIMWRHAKTIFTDESLSKVHYNNRFISCSNVSDSRLETLCKKGYNEVLFLVKLQSWTSNLIKSRALWQVFSCKFG